MDGLMVAIVVAALIIGALLMIFIQLTSRGRGQIDKECTRGFGGKFCAMSKPENRKVCRWR